MNPLQYPPGDEPGELPLSEELLQRLREAGL